jgi:hypothetical protein
MHVWLSDNPKWVCHMENEMTKSKLLSASLAAAVMLATPTMASASRVTSPHLVANAYASAFPSVHHVSGPVGIRAPHVGAFATAPSDRRTCDVGDNPHIC